MTEISSLPLVGLKYVGRRHPKVMGGAPISADLVVIHWSGGSKELQGLYRYLARKPNAKDKPEESYGYGVDRLGAIGEFMDPADASWHAGDGWLPFGDELERSDFVDVLTAKRPPPRHINLRSVGICLCNRGYVTERDSYGLMARGIRLLEGRHRNPASQSKRWEPYTELQISALGDLLAMLRERLPTLRYITGHEDVTNRYAAGRGTPQGGSKLDPGPAFAWDRLRLRELGLRRVMYDYRRQGWSVDPLPCPTVS